MEQMPNEIVENILYYVDGIAFIHMRCTCKRFKNIVDNMEVKSNPTPWRRYICRDFSLPAIESVLPVIHLVKPEDTATWKSVYMLLTKSKKSMVCVKATSVSLEVNINPYHSMGGLYIKFIGAHLCYLEYKIIYILGLKKTSDPQTFRPITDLRYSSIGPTMSVKISPYKHLQDSVHDLIVRPHHWKHCLSNGDSLFHQYFENAFVELKSRNTLPKGSQWLKQRIKEPNIANAIPHVSDTEMMLLSDQRLILGHHKAVLYFDSYTVTMTVCLFEGDGSSNSREYSFPLSGSLYSWQLWGESLICLMTDSMQDTKLLIAQIEVDYCKPSNKWVSLGPWHEISVLDTDRHCRDCIADFEQQGLCLAVATKNGKVYLGHLQELNAWQFDEPVQVELHKGSGFLISLALDINSGTVVSVVEAFNDGSCWKQKIHLLFFDEVS